MTFDKGHKEFHTLDMQGGWQVPAGYPPGFQQKIIAGALDENSKRGNRTRLLRIAPGTFSTAPFVHDYWEEVFLLAGDLIVGNDEDGKSFAITPTPFVRPGSITGRSSPRPDACSWRRTTTIEAPAFDPRGVGRPAVRRAAGVRLGIR